MDTDLATPARELGADDPAGYRLLRNPGVSYLDGAEEAVLRIVSAAQDRRSHSVEMLSSASGWAQRYHVHPARANVLRPLELPSDARVLEIGAGCGAISRYIGEQCAVVDALEPVPARAAVAAARTADLPGVQVFVGELADIPAEPSYDVIVVIGVLEYIGGGSADRQPYLDFLAGVQARLVPGGSLVLAIENELGVKYLVGAPEDHTNRIFDSIEGYPRGGPARTFSRRVLEQLVADAGLEPRTHVAFPDYKLARAVFGELPEHARSLLYRIPTFPSPDWRAPRPRLADEHSVWRRLVEAGLESEFGNSFLVLAGKGGSSTLWPSNRAGAFYTSSRRAELNTATVLHVTEDGRLTFVRTPVGEPADGDGVVRALPSSADFRPGTDVIALVAEGGVAEFARVAPGWLDLVDEALAREPESAIDVVPHNLVVDDDGHLHLIDIELRYSPVTREQVIRRGVFWLADRAAALTVPERWDGARTVGDVMRALGAVVGLCDPSWIETAMTEDGVFMAHVLPPPKEDMTDAERGAQIAGWLRERVERRLADLPLGERLPSRHRTAQDQLKQTKKRVQQLEHELADTRRRLAAAEGRAAGSPAVRLKRAVARGLPPGSRRRSSVDRLRGR